MNRQRDIPGIVILSAALAAGALATRPEETVQVRRFTPNCTIQVTAAAQEAATITNPLNWPHLRYVVPDGSFVEKGTVITEFDPEDLKYQKRDAEFEQAAAQRELERKLRELANAESDLRDRLDGYNDRIAVFKTQLKRLRSLPDPDDVAIAQGRLTVAQMAAEAADKDLDTARDRFARGMISQAEVDGYDKASREARARLQYREKSLALIREGARPATIRITELRMANVQMEADRVARQLEENQTVSAIERRGAQAQAGLIDRRVAELTDYLDKTKIRAPVSGHVVYMSMFRKHTITSGDRMWKGFAFMTMPKPDTIAFKGAVLETDRRNFQRGDQAAIRLASRPAEQLLGTIAGFSKLSRDRGETEGQQNLQNADSGVMVYDVLVQVAELPDWVRVGSTGECRIESSKSEEYASVSACFVKYIDGVPHLSIEGVYTPVEGRFLEGYFVLNDRDLMGRTVALFGGTPADTPDDEHGDKAGRLSASGELEPADTADVVVGDIHRWQKVAWLVPEDSQVEAGTVVCQLDKTDTETEIRKREGALQRLVSKREREEEAVKLRARQNGFALRRAQNNLEIATLQEAEVLANPLTAAQLNACLAAELAGIRHHFLERDRARLEARSVTSKSPLEIARLERNCTRAALQLEAARIRLDVLERDPEDLQKARVATDRKDMELQLITQRHEGETDEDRNGWKLRQAQREERRARDQVKEMQQRLANLTLRAPRTGLIQYKRVWSGGVWSKVAVGSQVGQRVAVMSVADVSRMYIRVELPERHYANVSEGQSVDVLVPALADTVLRGRVSEIEFLFRRKHRKDTEVGLYSGHEALGETVFFARVEIGEQQGIELKPGAMAEVVFPFEP